jgi:hypothetical protein
MHPHPTQPVIRVASAAALFSALQARNSFTGVNPTKSTSPTLGDVLGAPQRELDTSSSAALIPSAVLPLASVDPMSHEPLRLKLWINVIIGFLGLALCACYLAQDWEQQQFLVAVALGGTRDPADVELGALRTRRRTYTRADVHYAASGRHPGINRSPSPRRRCLYQPVHGRDRRETSAAAPYPQHSLPQRHSIDKLRLVRSGFGSRRTQRFGQRVR